MGIDESEYRNIEQTFYGEQANVEGILCCDPCMQVIYMCGVAEHILCLAKHLGIVITQDMDISQVTDAVQKHRQELVRRQG
jgi:hypothetical protein